MKGLYIHIPFCVRKCAYCDFYSLPGRLDSLDSYIDALLTEASTHRGLSFQTLYLGGGTPSLLGAQGLSRLLDGLRRIFDLLAENLPCLSMIPREIAPFRPGPPELAGEALEAVLGARPLLTGAIEGFAATGEWTAGTIGAAIKSLGSRLGVKGKALYMPVRAAVTGAQHGPDLSLVLEIRGRENVLACLRAALGRIDASA